jgi:hypothetical protein
VTRKICTQRQTLRCLGFKGEVVENNGEVIVFIMGRVGVTRAYVVGTQLTGSLSTVYEIDFAYSF